MHRVDGRRRGQQRVSVLVQHRPALRLDRRDEQHRIPLGPGSVPDAEAPLHEMVVAVVLRQFPLQGGDLCPRVRHVLGDPETGRRECRFVDEEAPGRRRAREAVDLAHPALRVERVRQVQIVDLLHAPNAERGRIGRGHVRRESLDPRLEDREDRRSAAGRQLSRQLLKCRTERRLLRLQGGRESE